MPLRLYVGLALLMGGGMLGASCSAPAPDASGEADAAPQAYHVQLDMTKEKEVANRMVGRALKWWETQAASVGPRPISDGSSPVTVAWRAPLYRVWLGPFASRAAADSVQDAAQSAFPGAFVRPGRAPPDP